MRRPENSNSIENGSGNIQARDIHGITPEQHERMLDKRVAEVRADLEARFEESKRADAAERKLLEVEISGLRNEIAELERRLANPEDSYRQYLTKIAELEKLLEDATDATARIGANRIADAKAALEQGDFSAADEIFAEVQQIEAEAVKRAAEASYGRGLIAEEEVRWPDAADHYARAARLDPTYLTLGKAGPVTV